MKSTTTYECEKCGGRSPDRAVIERCEAIPIRPAGVEVGDVVYIGGEHASGYGWWEGDREWFLDKPGDPNSSSHHVRGTIGHPLFVVVGTMTYRDTNSHMVGEHAHREVAILYSPSHANRGEGRKTIGWNGDTLTVVRKVEGEELARLQAEASALLAGKMPGYMSH